MLVEEGLWGQGLRAFRGLGFRNLYIRTLSVAWGSRFQGCWCQPVLGFGGFRLKRIRV